MMQGRLLRTVGDERNRRVDRVQRRRPVRVRHRRPGGHVLGDPKTDQDHRRRIDGLDYRRHIFETRRYVDGGPEHVTTLLSL